MRGRKAPFPHSGAATQVWGLPVVTSEVVGAGDVALSQPSPGGSPRPGLPATSGPKEGRAGHRGSPPPTAPWRPQLACTACALQPARPRGPRSPAPGPAPQRRGHLRLPLPSPPPPRGPPRPQPPSLFAPQGAASQRQTRVSARPWCISSELALSGQHWLQRSATGEAGFRKVRECPRATGSSGRRALQRASPRCVGRGSNSAGRAWPGGRAGPLGGRDR